MTTALYKFIYEDIKTRIKYNILSPGQNLPSESDLSKKYNCSRDTVRKAISLLEHDNLIEKSRGKKSIVLENNINLFPTSTLESFKEFQLKNKLNAKTILIDKTVHKTNDLKFIKEINSEQVLVLQRKRLVNNIPFVLDIDILDKNIINDVSKKIAEDSIYEYFENKLNLEISYSKKTVNMVPIEKQFADILNIEENTLIPQVISITYLKNGACFQYSISYHLPEKFSFVSYASR